MENTVNGMIETTKKRKELKKMKNFKRALTLLLAGIMAASVLAGCNQKADNQIIMGLDDSFPPMGFSDDNGELVGFDIDLAKAVAEKAGFELKLQPINWSSKETELDTGKVDILWNGLTITDKRKEAMTFTEPYLKNRQVVIVLADSNINTLADMKDKTIVLQEGSTAVTALDSEENKVFKDGLKGEPTLFADNLKCFMEVELKRADAVVIDEIVADYFMNQETQKGKFRKLDEYLADELYGIAVKKGNTELRDKIQNALNELDKEGKIAEICKTWFGEDVYYRGE